MVSRRVTTRFSYVRYGIMVCCAILLSACGTITQNGDSSSQIAPLAVESTTGFPITHITPVVDGGFAYNHFNDSGIVAYYTGSRGIVYNSVTEELTDLNALVSCPRGSNGGQGTIPRGVNASGQVVFECYTNETTPTGSVSVHSYIWDAVNQTEAFQLPGSHLVQARDMNDARQVVGFAHFPNGTGGWLTRGFVWSPGDTSLTAIPVLTTDNTGLSYAWDINASGQVVGQTDTSTAPYRQFFVRSPDGGMTLLGVFPRSDVFINDAGEVAGNYYHNVSTPDQEGRMFYWSPTTGVIDLGNGDVRAINASGLVLGHAEGEAFVWSPTTRNRTVLGSLGASGPYVTNAYDLNDAGQVVGQTRTTDTFNPYAGFFWDPETGMQDLGVPANLPSAVASGGQRINNSGQVLGAYLSSSVLYMAIWDVSRDVPPPNAPPTVDAGGPYSGLVNTTISLSGATASDPDGSDTLTYEWNHNGDTNCSFTDATALNPGFTCTADGTYTVTLSVRDNVNNPVTATASVSVTAPPVVTIELSINQPGQVGRSTGVATVSGTANCSGPTSFDLLVGLSQMQTQGKGKNATTVTVTGDRTITIQCNGNTAWTSTLSGTNGTFVQGSADATAKVVDSDPENQVARSIRLQGTK